MHALIQVGFVQEYIEIYVNKISRIPSECRKEIKK